MIFVCFSIQNFLFFLNYIFLAVERSAINKETQLQSIKLEYNFDDVNLQDLPVYKFEELVVATDNFAENNKLGQGGFGPVYKVMYSSIYV